MAWVAPGPYRIEPGHGPEALQDADTVVIPGTHAPGRRMHGTVGGRLAEALARFPPTARLMSICTGAPVLAAAGRLDGRPATTHWARVAEFRALYPRCAWTSRCSTSTTVTC